jgi:N,N-dimethylformamidase beta subunit-like, C-terminal/Bacterial Ig domain
VRIVAGGQALYASALAALFGALALTLLTGSAWAQVDPCAAPANEIVAENCLPGTPATVWDVDGAGDPSIQGFATDISVDQGQAVQVKVDTTAAAYRLDIYRMGWYGGDGARLVATVPSSATIPQNQPECLSDGPTGLIDCGNWTASASWSVPGTAVSGIYFARLVREDTGGASHVPFIVRDDDGRSDLLFQTSDTTWQAYNRYGGNSLYTGSPAGRAYKVSYNRPFTTREYAAEDWVFNAEYPMVRWLERNGYDVSYFTGVDTDRLGAELREHRAFLSVGHDEYWSGTQRANVEAARDAGVHLAFFSGNEVFWKTRWENGHRTLVSYKETHANAKIDPTPVWTGTWRDPRPFNPEGGRPENALTGTIFSVNSGTRALQVPAAEGRLRLWRTAGLAPGGTTTLAADAVGYEWDEDLDNGARPPGLVRLSATTASGVEKLLDFGSTYGPGTATHRLTLYRDPNGAGPDALAFGAGTVQWSWGLDGEHDRGGSTPSVPIQQASVNLLADMLVQAATLQAGLTPAGASTDTTPPISRPNTPTRIVTAGTPVTVSGTAADSGGGRVGGVEVSVDGALTWHPAAGLESWSYTWTPTVGGQVTVRSRAVDDSGNLEGRDGGGSTGGGVPPGTPPVGGTPPPATGPGTPAADQVAPQVRVRPRRVRASRRGLVKLRVTCPAGEAICRIDLRLRRAGTTVARKRLEVRGGTTREVSLRLTMSARRRLLRSGSMSSLALAAARDLAANRGITSTRIRVLAPRGT